LCRTLRFAPHAARHGSRDDPTAVAPHRLSPPVSWFVVCHAHGTILRAVLPRAWDHAVASHGTTSVSPTAAGGRGRPRRPAVPLAQGLLGPALQLPTQHLRSRRHRRRLAPQPRRPAPVDLPLLAPRLCHLGPGPARSPYRGRLPVHSSQATADGRGRRYDQGIGSPRSSPKHRVSPRIPPSYPTRSDTPGHNERREANREGAGHVGCLD